MPATDTASVAKPARVRRVWRRLGVLLGALVTAVVLLPFWFPLALKPALRHFGVQAGGVHRAGCAALRLREVQYRADNVDVQVRELRLPQPTARLWHRWFGSAEATNALIVVTDWRVAVGSGEINAAPTAEPSAPPGAVLDDLNRVAAVLNRWLPRTEVHTGRVAVAGREIHVPTLRWRPGGLELDASLAEADFAAQIALDACASNQFVLEVREPARQFTLRLDLRAQDPVWALAGSAAWRDNVFELCAQIGRETAGPWPDRLELHAPQIYLPAPAIGLPGYSNLLGHGTLTATLAAPNGQVRMLADGVEPVEGSPLAGRLPRLEGLELNLRADFRVVRLEPLRLRVEGTPFEVAAELPLS